MKVKIFGIRDLKVGAFMQPFYAEHAGSALRSFDQLVNDGKSTLSQYPEDFEIHEIGAFDDQQGVFESISPTKFLQSAAEAKRKAPREEPFLNS